MGDWGLGLHTAGGPLALFFREHLLLEEMPEARSGTWAPQVRSAALWTVGGPALPLGPHRPSHCFHSLGHSTFTGEIVFTPHALRLTASAFCFSVQTSFLVFWA